MPQICFDFLMLAVILVGFEAAFMACFGKFIHMFSVHLFFARQADMEKQALLWVEYQLSKRQGVLFHWWPFSSKCNNRLQLFFCSILNSVST